MRTSTIVWVVVILLILAGGGWYYYSTKVAPGEEATEYNNQQTAPSGTAGVNGSANQGNLGASSTGAVQQPQDNDSGAVQKTDINVASDPKLGKYLTADNTSIHQNDMTLYTFANDTAGKSNCTGQCAANWPALLVASADAIPNAGSGVTGKLSTIPHGTQYQVTYNGKPLYFYIGDKTAGDTTGQNIGKVWFVAKP